MSLENGVKTGSLFVTLGLENEEEREKEVQIVRDRWNRLREIYSAIKN